MGPRDLAFKLDPQARQEPNGAWRCRCPAHDDQNPSLNVWEDRGRIRWKCHAGCSKDAVLRAAGLDPATLNGHGRPERQFLYRDASGQAVFIVHREERPTGKRIWQTGPLGERKLPATLSQAGSRPLYRLPELMRRPSDAPVLVVEGEPHVDKLVALGFAATTTSQGAGKARWTDLRPLVGRDVILLPDNDDAGHSHMRDIASRLRALGQPAERIRWLELPGLPPKGDVLDWLAAGHSADELRTLLTQTLEAEASESEDPASPLRVVSLAEVQPEPVRWLWEPYIPRGKLTLIDGAPAAGKSWLTLAIAAAVTTGAPWPGTTQQREPGTVLLFAGEDGIADTILPRLQLAGADTKKVFGVQTIDSDQGPRAVDLTQDWPVVRNAILTLGPQLVVFDPIQAVAGARTDLNAANQVRAILAPLAALAEESGAAILVVRHLRKSGTDHALYRGLGSIDFAAAARSVLLVARDPDHPAKRGMAQIKNSLGPEGAPLAYTIADAGLQWLGEDATLTAERLLAPAVPESEASALEEAVEFLRQALANGPRLSSEMFDEADAAGISRRTLQRAKQRLQVRSWRSSEKRWLWQLPEDRHVARRGNVGDLGDLGKVAKHPLRSPTAEDLGDHQTNPIISILSGSLGGEVRQDRQENLSEAREAVFRV